MSDKNPNNENVQSLPVKEAQEDSQVEQKTEDAVETSEEPVEVQEESVEETSVVEPVEEVQEDRSAFNCLPCGGDGIVEGGRLRQGELCSNCLGSGKV